MSKNVEGTNDGNDPYSLEDLSKLEWERIVAIPDHLFIESLDPSDQHFIRERDSSFLPRLRRRINRFRRESNDNDLPESG